MPTLWWPQSERSVLCVISPLLWTCVTGTMVRDLVSRGITIADLDLYADDFLRQETLHDYEAFELALKRMGIIIHYLQEQGLQVSMDKTVVLMRIAGARSSMAMARHTFKRKDREGIERVHIKIPAEHDTFHLPVVKEHKYMGIMATYYGYTHASHFSCQKCVYAPQAFSSQSEKIVIAREASDVVDMCVVCAALRAPVCWGNSLRGHYTTWACRYAHACARGVTKAPYW